MKKMIKHLLAFFRTGVIYPIPSGIVPDSVGMWGLFGLAQNMNAYTESLSSIVTSGTAVTLVASSVNQQGAPGDILAGFTRLDAGATGALTATLPSTSSILAALGNTAQQDATYWMPAHIMNNSGQTVTLAAGDSNTTLLGSMTVNVGQVRKLLLRVMNSSNVSFTNVGAFTL